jgi:hypothetical protein
LKIQKPGYYCPAFLLGGADFDPRFSKSANHPPEYRAENQSFTNYHFKQQNFIFKKNNFPANHLINTNLFLLLRFQKFWKRVINKLKIS